jgi:nucleotide-binding universal stress UspA family protein
MCKTSKENDMAYKTLFSVVTDIALANQVLDQAIAMAQAQDAHLDVLCMGLDRTQTGFYYAGANAMILQETITRAQEEAREVEAYVKKILTANDVRWSLDSGVSQLADMGRHVAQRARFADLAILPQPYGVKRGVELEPILEAAMFDGATPVLMVPELGSNVIAPKRILLAWNESDEALAATRTALPFLKQADSVRIVVIDPPAHSPTRSDPGGLLSQYLSRHGVNCEIDVLSKTMPRVSDVLMRHATDTDSDMIVMGAYGHSRFREAILGGATRNMLENAKIPVFLAH